MAAWSGLSAGARLAAGALAGVVTAVAGWMVWEGIRPAPAPVPEKVADTPAAMVSETPVASDPVPEPVPEAVATEPSVPEPPAPPEIGTWLVTAEGSATIAGIAAPEALVRVLVDGVPVAETVATGSGEFAVVTDLAPNTQPSLMTLVMVLEDGTEVPSVQSVALGPIAGPVPVAVAADAAPEAETEGPAALMLTDEGATVLQDADGAAPEVAPGEVAPVTIETIAYTAAGAVQLGGVGQPGAFVRIYLDNRLLQEVLIPESGTWLTTLKETAPGLYTLRADQVDDMGFVTSRFETPFKRETLEALAAAAGADAAPEAADPAPATTAETTPVEQAPEAMPAEPVAEAVPEATPAEPVAEAAPETMPAEPVAEAAPEAMPAEPVAEAASVEPAPEADEVASALVVPAEEPTPDVGVAEVVPEPMAPASEATAEVTAEPAPEAIPEAPAITEAPEPETVIAGPAPEPASEAPPEPVAVTVAEAEPSPPSPEPPPPAPPVSVTVQPGHTLWAIAQGQMGEGVMYVQVYEANKDKIRDPDLIYPGQVFTIPAAD